MRGGHNLIDLTGRRIGRLTVMRLLPKDGRHRKWECRCECGRTHVTRAINLQREDTKSCGCLNDEMRLISSRTHGATRTPTWHSWVAMRKRCSRKSPMREYYFDRGITVCERWQEFENFLADMGERLPGTTLDRINVDKNYEPENCRWATHKVQRLNRRDVKLYTYAGKTMCLTDWIREVTGADDRITLRPRKA